MPGDSSPARRSRRLRAPLAMDLVAIVLLIAVFGSLWGLVELLDRV
jgi:hypothetical protein